MKIKKILNRCLVLLNISALLSVSCTKGCEENNVLLTKVFSAGYPTDCSSTKLLMNPGFSFLWTRKDKIYYYTTTGETTTSSASSPMDAVTLNHTGGIESASVPVSYTSEKTHAVAIFKGEPEPDTPTSSPSAVSAIEFSLNDGIRATQDGTIESNIVCSAISPLDGDGVFKMDNLQTFISFSLSRDGVNLGNYNEIKVTDIGGSAIAGKMTWNIVSKTGTFSGSGKSITLNPLKGKGEVYYVAIKPGIYNKGLAIQFCKDGSCLEVFRTKENTNVAAGKINELGSLDNHGHIVGKGLAVIPAESSIICKSDLQQTKKLWAYFENTDATGVQWKSSNDEIATVEGGPEEEYFSKHTFTATVIPKKEGAVTITAYDVWDSSVKATCTVNIGDWIDLGSDILWAGTNLESNADGSIKHLCSTATQGGSYFMWGFVTPQVEGTKWTTATYCARFGGSWSDTKSNTAWGGKYNTYTGGKTILENIDDVATKTNSAWRMPYKSEFNDLCNSANYEDVSGVFLNGYGYSAYRSLKEGYTDVAVYFPYLGQMNEGGFIKQNKTACFYYCKDLTLELWGLDGRPAAQISRDSYKVQPNQNGQFFCPVCPDNNSYTGKYKAMIVRPVKPKS